MSILLIAFSANVALAQAVNYMDEAGTIHFADSPLDVPMQYRDQVIKKKPAVLDKKQYREAQKDFKKQQQDALRQKKIEEKTAQKLAKEKAKQREKTKADEERDAAKKQVELAKTSARLKPKKNQRSQQVRSLESLANDSTAKDLR